MADRAAPAMASRGAFLELRDEEQLVQTGYRLLDEKRVQLAAEILEQRRAYRTARNSFAVLCETASAALLEAAAAHGLNGLQVLPAGTFDAALSIESRPFVGLFLVTAELAMGKDPDIEPGHAADGAVRDCIDAFRTVLAAGVTLAARVTNLERLMSEYRRTERRVRALENVILPEIRSDIAMMQEQIDLNEQEEVIRVHTLRPRRDYYRKKREHQ